MNDPFPVRVGPFFITESDGGLHIDGGGSRKNVEVLADALLGWLAGGELREDPSVAAALGDSLRLHVNSWTENGPDALALLMASHEVEAKALEAVNNEPDMPPSVAFRRGMEALAVVRALPYQIDLDRATLKLNALESRLDKAHERRQQKSDADRIVEALNRAAAAVEALAHRPLNAAPETDGDEAQAST